MDPDIAKLGVHFFNTITQSYTKRRLSNMDSAMHEIEDSVVAASEGAELIRKMRTVITRERRRESFEEILA